MSHKEECRHSCCCCSGEKQSFLKAPKCAETYQDDDKPADHSTPGGHHHHHHHKPNESNQKVFLLIALSIVLLLVAFQVGRWFKYHEALPWIELIAYTLALLPVGLPVLLEAIATFKKEKSFFNEFTLMTMASLGAFIIKEYPEGVILMILYNIGEWLQGLAVGQARQSISELVDVRTVQVTKILPDGSLTTINAEEALPGDRLRILAGMRISVDGTLASDSGTLDLSALTGESRPEEVEAGAKVLAGSIAVGKPIDLIVTKKYEDSTLARILTMAEEAAERKPQTERFIRRFARVYTPAVTALAFLVVFLPWIWSLLRPDFVYFFDDWLYRGLVFLVTSCPCALIIGVPLTYFCGIGAASRSGILFKGAVFLERLKKITIAIFDKTGTLTEGSFAVTEIRTDTGYTENEVLSILTSAEQHSTHPMAVAVTKLSKERGITASPLYDIREVTGMGIAATTSDGASLLAGSERLMHKEGITIPDTLCPKGESAVLLAINGNTVGAVILRDRLKVTSIKTIKALHAQGIKKVVMLSGDKSDVVDRIARELGIDTAIAELLPDGKMQKVEEFKANNAVLFVGDGLNDAPVMNLADVGIAMGGIGSDATIEAADLVIQGDNPYKVPEAIAIARRTNKIVRQNIIFALGFKFAVMALATIGFASLPLAVIADVGVTLIVIANSLRALKIK